MKFSLGDDSPHRHRVIRSALAGGGLAAVVFLATSIGLGSVGDREAIVLLESTLPTIRFLCSSAIGASATVVALMLTLLGLSRDLEGQIRPDYYHRIGHIGTMCVAVMVTGVGLLLVLCIPLAEAEEFATWYNTIYYSILVVASLLGGGLVAITLTLRRAVTTLVAAAHPDAESRMFIDDDDDEAEAGGGSDPGGDAGSDEAEGSAREG